jgi:hypothetical protein
MVSAILVGRDEHSSGHHTYIAIHNLYFTNDNRVSEGHAFAIHDPDVFMTDIAPHFFDKQSCIRSFHRQLSIWVSSYRNVVAVSLITYPSFSPLRLSFPRLLFYISYAAGVFAS